MVRGRCRTNLPLENQSRGWGATQAREPGFPVEKSPLAHRQWVLIASPRSPQKAISALATALLLPSVAAHTPGKGSEG